MALRDKRTNISFDLWCLVASRGVDICISSTSFQKNYIGWPQQPPTERASGISEKLEFGWSIPQKGIDIGHLGARDDQKIRISKDFDEMRLSRSLRQLRSWRLQRFLRPEKSLLKTLGSSRHINSALFLCFEKKFFCVESWNIIMNFSNFSIGGCWGQPRYFFFFENWLMRHKCPNLLKPLGTIT